MQLGLHFGELTCRETLDFAAYCRGTDTCMGGFEHARLATLPPMPLLPCPAQLPVHPLVCWEFARKVFQPTLPPASCKPAGVGQVGQLEARERQLGIHADHATAYFMTALQAASRHSLATDLMLRLLGLEACADTPVVRVWSSLV